MKPATMQQPVSAFADVETPQQVAAGKIYAVKSKLLTSESMICGARSLVLSDPDLSTDPDMQAAMVIAQLAFEQLRKIELLLDYGPADESEPRYWQVAPGMFAELHETLGSASARLQECDRHEESLPAIYADTLMQDAAKLIHACQGDMEAAAALLNATPPAADLLSPIMQRAADTAMATAAASTTTTTNANNFFADDVCCRAGRLASLAHAASALLDYDEFAALNLQAWHAREVVEQIAESAKKLSGDALNQQSRGAL